MDAVRIVEEEIACLREELGSSRPRPITVLNILRDRIVERIKEELIVGHIKRETIKVSDGLDEKKYSRLSALLTHATKGE